MASKQASSALSQQKSHKQHKEHKKSNEHKEHKQHKDHKEQKTSNEPKDLKTSNEPKDQKTSNEPQEQKTSNEPKDPKTSNEPKDSKTSNEDPKTVDPPVKNNTDSLELQQDPKREKHARLFGLGLKAYRNGDYVLAKEYFDQLLTAGNPRVFYYLAAMYERGKGTQLDIIKARYFYELALTETRSELLQKYQLIDVLTSLGLIYNNGLAVDHNYIKARPYFERTITLYDSPTDLYDTIDPKDDVPRRKSGFISSASESLASMSSSSSSLSLEIDVITPELRREHTDDTQNLMSLSCFLLARIHYNGQDTAKDYQMSVLYFNRALSEGDNEALVNLVRIYYEGGYGVPRDYQKAREYAEKAYATTCHNYADSVITLATIHQYGYGVPINISLALSLLITCLNMPAEDLNSDLRADVYKRFRLIFSTNANLNLFIDEYAGLVKKSNKTITQIAQLKRKNEQLQRQVDYQPDGPGYLAAKEDFELQNKIQTQ